MKKLFLISTLGLLGLSVSASEKTDKNWAEQLRSEGLTANDQSYCYTNADGKIEGKNIDMRIRLASVSKLLTSLWAIEKLGIDYKYDLKLFIKGNNLHIQGSFDPFLGNEKMFFLLSQLNDLGFQKFDTITFDKNLLINPNAQYYSDEYPTMNAVTNGRYLRNYFNTKTWSTDTKEEYAHFYNISPAGKFRKQVNFEVSNVQFAETNPYLNDEEATVLTLSSPALYKYLKEMNVRSNNYVAETIYRQLGSNTNFEQFLNERFNLSADQIQFFTGSGLPAYINGVRKDNYATCSIMLNLITELKKSIEAQAREIEDVMAVPGSDAGTFRNRIFPSDYKNSFVAKTGTLMHTSTLAGAMNTQTGFSFFGIFNQSTNLVGSKVVQNSMVKSIMTDMGGPLAFNYVVEQFHTYNDLKDFDLNNDFSTIEHGLY